MRQRPIQSVIASSTYIHESQQNGILQEIDLKESGVVRYNRSDITHNTAVNGYRNPSSYQTSIDFPSISHSTVKGPVVVCTGEIHEVSPNWPDWTRRITGSGIAQVVGVPGYIQANYNSEQELLHKVLLKARDEVWDVTMTFGELQATANGVGTMLNRLGRSMQMVSHKDARAFNYLWNGTLPRTYKGREVSPKQMLRRGISLEQTSPLTGRRLDNFNRNVSSMWLEWKYGITPTLIDIKGACKALDIAEKGSLWENAPVVTKRAQVIHNHSENTEARLQVSQRAITKRVTVKFKDTYKARLDYRITGDAMRGLNRLGIGLSSVVTLAWDKKPFSFVFDMAVPIASTIKASTALDGCTPVGYCRTIHRETTIDSDSTFLYKVDDPYNRGSGIFVGPKWVVPSIMVRSASASPPIPLPFVKNPLKAQNMMTVLSLFTQLRKSAK